MKSDIRYQAAILKDHHLLLLKIWDHAGSGKTFWVLPGGEREPNETEEDCVKREVREETHMEVEIDRPIADEPDLIDGAYQRLKTYACRILCGEPLPGIEPGVDTTDRNAIQSIGWFDLSDLQTWDPLECAASRDCPGVRTLGKCLVHTRWSCAPGYGEAARTCFF